MSDKVSTLEVEFYDNYAQEVKTIKKEVKPCPFCGNIKDGKWPDLRILGAQEGDYPDVVFVTCDRCGCMGPFAHDFDELEALNKWNRRSKKKLTFPSFFDFLP